MPRCFADQELVGRKIAHHVLDQDETHDHFGDAGHGGIDRDPKEAAGVQVRDRKDRMDDDDSERRDEQSAPQSEGLTLHIKDGEHDRIPAEGREEQRTGSTIAAGIRP